MKKLFLLAALVCIATCSAIAQKYRVTIVTNKGTIKMMLYDGTPLHRDNMVALIKKHFYDSTLFHRVIPNFVIQGGDPESKRAAAGVMLGDGDVGYRVPAEIKPEYYHKRGAVGMARDPNPEKASSGCQFYIVVGKVFTDEELAGARAKGGRELTPEQQAVYKKEGGTPHLDGGYTIFGEVTDGMDVVDKIALETTTRERPNTDVRMLKVTVKKKKRFLIF